MTTEEINGPTPSGGVKAILHYRDKDGNPAEKDTATQVEILEYDKDGKCVNRTYGTIGAKPVNLDDLKKRMEQ